MYIYKADMDLVSDKTKKVVRKYNRYVSRYVSKRVVQFARHTKLARAKTHCELYKNKSQACTKPATRVQYEKWFNLKYKRARDKWVVVSWTQVSPPKPKPWWETLFKFKF